MVWHPGILDHTKTTLGRALLRTWLLRPTLSIPVINARQDAVECFLHVENLATADIMQDHLRGVKNMPRTLRIMKSGRAKVSDWQALVKVSVIICRRYWLTHPRAFSLRFIRPCCEML